MQRGLVQCRIYHNSPKLRCAKSVRDISRIPFPRRGKAGEASVSALRRSALLACLTALLAACALVSHVEARQGFGGFFWSGPFFEPPSRQRYYASPRRRHYAPSRKRKVVRSDRRRSSKSPKSRVALAVPNEATGDLGSITCEKAETIVAEFGFKNIEVQLCAEKNFEFRAVRDGKQFSIKLKGNGELAKVQRLR
jgi:hypothetical protein